MVGVTLMVAFTVIALVVWFVYAAMDVGRYQWATELLGRSVDRLFRRKRS